MSTITELLVLLKGRRTYLAAVGFLCLAAYHASQSQPEKAGEMLLAALTAAGLRAAISSPPAPPPSSPAS